MNSQIEQPIELRDYKQFEERYEEFLAEHKDGIIKDLQYEYLRYYFRFEKKSVNLSRYIPRVVFLLGLLLLFFVLVLVHAPFTWGSVAFVVVGVMALLFAGFCLVSHYKTKAIKAMFMESERKRVLADYVAREEERLLDKLALHYTLDENYLNTQNTDIQGFYKECLERLCASKFTRDLKIEIV